MLGVLVAGMLLASPDVAWARLDRTTCSCKDLRDLKNRQREAEYAIVEYYQAILDIEADERRTGKPVLTTWATYKDWLQPRVQRLLNELKNRDESLGAGSDTRAATGETGFFFCQSSVVTGSACLAGSVPRHERVHPAACSRYHWEEGNIFPLEYKRALRLVDVAKEEIAAYEAERFYIDDKLAKLRCDYKVDMTPAEPISASWSGAKCNGAGGAWKIQHKNNVDLGDHTGAGKLELTFDLDEQTLKGAFTETLIQSGRTADGSATCTYGYIGTVTFVDGEEPTIQLTPEWQTMGSSCATR